MPWSPVPKFPDIIRNLKARGYINEVGYQNIVEEVMRTLGLIGGKTISRTIRAMVTLGYIKDKGTGATFYICSGGPGKFPQDRIQADAEADMLLDAIGGAKHETEQS